MFEKRKEKHEEEHVWVRVDDDLGEMLNWAVRYSCGRQTYAPHDTVAFIMPLIPYLPDKTLWCFDNDMQDRIKNPELWGGFGDETIDKPVWMEFHKAVLDELAKREERK